MDKADSKKSSIDEYLELVSKIGFYDKNEYFDLNSRRIEQSIPGGSLLKQFNDE